MFRCGFLTGIVAQCFTQARKDYTRAVLREVSKGLRGFAGLGPDWDSYGAPPVAPQAISTAYRLFEDIVKAGGERVRPYAIVPEADGGVYMEWRGPKQDIEVDISPERKLGYLLVRHQESGDTLEERDDVTWLDLVNLVTETIR